jgi:hypothetical protein
MDAHFTLQPAHTVNLFGRGSLVTRQIALFFEKFAIPYIPKSACRESWSVPPVSLVTPSAST